jgi:hypothetical protein
MYTELCLKQFSENPTLDRNAPLRSAENSARLRTPHVQVHVISLISVHIGRPSVAETAFFTVALRVREVHMSAFMRIKKQPKSP